MKPMRVKYFSCYTWSWHKKQFVNTESDSQTVSLEMLPPDVFLQDAAIASRVSGPEDQRSGQN